MVWVLLSVTVTSVSLGWGCKVTVRPSAVNEGLFGRGDAGGAAALLTPPNWPCHNTARTRTRVYRYAIALGFTRTRHFKLAEVGYFGCGQAPLRRKEKKSRWPMPTTTRQATRSPTICSARISCTITMAPPITI